MLRYLTLILLLYTTQLPAQTLGGNAVFNFLSQPNNAALSALGGVNVSAIGNDVGMSFHSPSLLRAAMNQQASFSFNSFLAGIRNYSLGTAWRLEGAQTNLAIGANYFDYGNITQTDAAGNVLGTMRPVDYVVQATASRRYHERFFYGVTAKYVRSSYAQYRSSGLAADLGLSYYDSANQLQISVVVKNIGAQLTTYDGGNRREELPFDLQAGVTKRLAQAPLQFSATVHHLQAFNIHYNDTSFRASEGEVGYGGSTTLHKIFSHIVLSAQVFLGDKIELATGYNFQRRQDLNSYDVGSGLNGFSFGAALLLKKIHVRYATGFYQKNLFHQLSLNINWKGALQ